MNELLREELTTDPLGLLLKGAAPETAFAILNRPGTALFPIPLVSREPVFVEQKALTRMFSATSLGALEAFKGSPEGRAFKFVWETPGPLDIADAGTRAFVLGLAEVGVSMDEIEQVLMLGEVQRSRAQELLGRPATLEDFNA
ncbi:MAG: hypothetical protein ACLGSA_12445 [Acidobacteriota bacterium]